MTEVAVVRIRARVLLVSTGGRSARQSGEGTLSSRTIASVSVLPACGRGRAGTVFMIIQRAEWLYSNCRVDLGLFLPCTGLQSCVWNFKLVHAVERAPQFSHFKVIRFGHLFSCFRVPDWNVPRVKKVLVPRTLGIFQLLRGNTSRHLTAVW